MTGDIKARREGVSDSRCVEYHGHPYLTAVVKMGLESANGSMEDIAGNLSGLDGNVRWLWI